MNGEESTYPFKQYVWALGQGTNKIPTGDLVDNRYEVIAPSIWLDTQPEKSPKVPEPVPGFALPYLKAYPHQLNLPGVYGICHQDSGEAVLLLSNVPVNRQGQLMPAIAKAWPNASAFRQANWLWQMVSLWEPLQSFGASASLLKKSNIRVEAWRVRLIGLSTNPSDPTLGDLANAWEVTYLPGAKPNIAKLITAVCHNLRADVPDFQAIKTQVNDQLLQEAAGSSIEFQVVGATSAGPQKARNEDACYPSSAELKRTGAADLPLLPRLAIVCDGVGGHEGGEVASQMVVRSLQLQLRGLLAEAMEQPQAIAPQVVIEQIEAAVRVANNLVAQQNDQQGRANRQRMGTTLVMAIALPQRIETPTGPAEVSELYLTHIGDSRAYWITPEHCQQLTVDDDIAGREVSSGNSFYATACDRPDANALTQAVGLREYDQLQLHTQRFLFDSSGVLLLCSDGLSDNLQVEFSWANYIGLIVKKIVPLEAAAESWVELANQNNGHDNVAVALMSVDMLDENADSPLNNHSEVVVEKGSSGPRIKGMAARAVGTATTGGAVATLNRPAEMTAASRALLYGEDEEDDTPLTPEDMEIPIGEDVEKPKGQGLITVLLGLIILAVIGAVGWVLFNTFVNNSSSPNLPEQTEQSALEAPASGN
ncbi:MAG: PP2C family serine/threonine-protein phosphatase [Cyanobacteria bacterium J06598_3]